MNFNTKMVVFSVVLAIVCLIAGYLLNDYSTRQANRENNEELLRLLHEKFHLERRVDGRA